MVSRGGCVRNAGRRGLRRGLLLTTALGATALAAPALATGQANPPPPAKTAEQPAGASQVEEVVVIAVSFPFPPAEEGGRAKGEVG